MKHFLSLAFHPLLSSLLIVAGLASFSSESLASNNDLTSQDETITSPDQSGMKATFSLLF